MIFDINNMISGFWFACSSMLVVWFFGCMAALFYRVFKYYIEDIENRK